MGKTCFFIGHSTAGEELRPLLERSVERHILEYGVTSFTVGQYGGFDRLAIKVLREAKQCHPEIILSLLLPYHPYDRPTETPKGFDGTFYPPGMEAVPKRFAIPRANRYMIDNSDYLIAYAKYPGKARDFFEYAQRRERKGLLKIENLGGSDEFPTE